MTHKQRELWRALYVHMQVEACIFEAVHNLTCHRVLPCEHNRLILTLMFCACVQVEARMFEAVHDVTARGIECFPASERNDWVLEWPGMVVLVVTAVYWCVCVWFY